MRVESREFRVIDEYICEINKALIDLGAIEMDEVLKKIIPQNIAEINVNIDNNNLKIFKIDRSENIITGRGIKGFFKNIKSTKAITKYNEENNELLLKNLNEINSKDETFNLVKNSSKAYEIIKDLTEFKFGEERWIQIYEFAKDFATIPDFDKLLSQNHLREMNLFEYQIRTVKEVLKKFRGRALLCDEVGLGKTIEACTVMMEYIIRGLTRKILILVNPSLVEQWSNELKRKFNQDFITSDDPKFKKMGDKAWEYYPKVISSINLAKRKQNSEHILKIHYDMVIVDEAHHFKKIKIDKFSSNLIVNKERDRINFYYDSLKLEAEKRMKRKNLSEEKINEYRHKIKIYDIEKQRQLNEITEKYKVKSNVGLQNVVVYAVPMISLKYKLTGRDKSGEVNTCFYNTVLKAFRVEGVES